MYKIYFKQAIEMLKQNKFISMIAIWGTALAIMMIMAIIVTDNVKNIGVAPEINRTRTYYLPIEIIKDTTNGHWNAGNVSHHVFHDYIKDLQTPEYISGFDYKEALVAKENSKDYMQMTTKYVDNAYWHILSFPFLEGRPFSQEEFESGIPFAIITETAARKLFQGEQALGKSIVVNAKSYQVIGIVKDISPVFTIASADIWVPYTSTYNYKESSHIVMFLLRDAKDLARLEEELQKAEKRYGSNNPNKVLLLLKPKTHRTYIMNIWGMDDMQVSIALRMQYWKQLFIFLVLLLVPAINLSGLSLSRIKRRIEEIGVRKAFGAKRHHILIQVLFENLITSLIGGFIGLFLSYIVVIQLKEWLLKVPEESFVPINSLISPWVILAVFTVCILINLLSAGIPAYRASRATIVNSLSKNETN
ncbi:ABC transporter permease [Parabacteroides sp. PF5-9]|uniref:ABC transporter permease n=1 Tax=Parabacteroides sp. PF5-9 TaxID=1742404 RepID=UPI002475B90E|nr:ABC transporter permease [Parabacteroides sp. PF5-9]MDH6357958.1 hypothetical protein [Parabacteroides sp. PF5-9]